MNAVATAAPPADRAELLGIEAVRALFDPKVAASTIRDWYRQDLLPTFKIGRRRYVRRADVEAFIARAAKR